MHCENCHENEATEVVMKPDGLGGEIETFVCKACADRLRHARTDESDNEEEDEPYAEGPDRIHHVIRDPENAPPFVKNLLDATLGFIKGVSEQKKSADKCPACGRTFAEITDAEVLGCPECWKAFAGEIRSRYLAGQYGHAHIGPTPATSERDITRGMLERRLKAAISRQDFRKAAEIKAALDALDANGKDPS